MRGVRLLGRGVSVSAGHMDAPCSPRQGRCESSSIGGEGQARDVVPMYLKDAHGADCHDAITAHLCRFKGLPLRIFRLEILSELFGSRLFQLLGGKGTGSGGGGAGRFRVRGSGRERRRGRRMRRERGRDGRKREREGEGEAEAEGEGSEPDAPCDVSKDGPSCCRPLQPPRGVVLCGRRSRCVRAH